MADGNYVQVQPDGGGKNVEATERVDGDGTIYRQVVTLESEKDLVNLLVEILREIKLTRIILQANTPQSFLGNFPVDT